MHYVKNLPQKINNITNNVEDLPETTSVQIESLYQDLSQIESNLSSLSKNMKKKVKQSTAFTETLYDFPNTLKTISDKSKSKQMGFSRLCAIVSEFEDFHTSKRKDVELFLADVQQKLKSFNKNDVATALGEKKKFDGIKRQLDNVIINEQSLSKKSKDKQGKKQELQVEIDEKKQQFIDKGEETYNKLLDTFSDNDWQSISTLCSYYDVYLQYFQTCYQFLFDKKKRIT